MKRNSKVFEDKKIIELIDENVYKSGSREKKRRLKNSIGKFRKFL